MILLKLADYVLLLSGSVAGGYTEPTPQSVDSYWRGLGMEGGVWFLARAYLYMNVRLICNTPWIELSPFVIGAGVAFGDFRNVNASFTRLDFCYNLFLHRWCGRRTAFILQSDCPYAAVRRHARCSQTALTLWPDGFDAAVKREAAFGCGVIESCTPYQVSGSSTHLVVLAIHTLNPSTVRAVVDFPFCAVQKTVFGCGKTTVKPPTLYFGISHLGLRCTAAFNHHTHWWSSRRTAVMPQPKVSLPVHPTLLFWYRVVLSLRVVTDRPVLNKQYGYEDSSAICWPILFSSCSFLMYCHGRAENNCSKCLALSS